jgi:hypothetical protein
MKDPTCTEILLLSLQFPSTIGRRFLPGQSVHAGEGIFDWISINFDFPM